MRSRDSSVIIETRLRSGQPGFESGQRLGFYLFTTTSRPALGPIRHPINEYREGGRLSPGVKRSWPEADQSHLAPRSRMREAVPPLTHTSSWRGVVHCQGKLLPLLPKSFLHYVLQFNMLTFCSECQIYD
jgi:hypothetical protein